MKSEYFSGLFEKIAQNIAEITQSSSFNSKNSTNYGGSSGNSFNSYGKSNRSQNLQSTLSKSRDKADIQPLHKDTNTIYRPADVTTASRMSNKQKYLGHIEDKRITKNHLLN